MSYFQQKECEMKTPLRAIGCFPKVGQEVTQGCVRPRKETFTTRFAKPFDTLYYAWLLKRIAMTARTEIILSGKRIPLSNLDKVFYPELGFTKGQVIDYYIQV